MSGKRGARCPLCGLPASLRTARGIDLIGCPCAKDREMHERMMCSYWLNAYEEDRIRALSLPVVLMTDNHDPGDEDRSER